MNPLDALVVAIGVLTVAVLIYAQVRIERALRRFRNR